MAWFGDNQLASPARPALNVVRQCGSFASSRISRVVPDALLSVLAAKIRCLRLSI